MQIYHTEAKCTFREVPLCRQVASEGHGGAWGDGRRGVPTVVTFQTRAAINYWTVKYGRSETHTTLPAG